MQHAVDTGDVAAAFAACHEQIALAPEDAEAHRHLGQLHAAAREFVAAHRCAVRSCTLAPDDPRSWSDLGRVYALEARHHDASTCFAEAVQIDPRFADGWHNLGTALKAVRDRDGAFKALKNALLLDPSRAETYLNLGNLLIETGQLEDAIECFERAARHDPTLARARSRLAQQLSQSGKVKRAEQLFRQSVGLDPQHVQGWFGLGRTLEDVGDADNALACYEQVLARQPGHAMALGQYLALVKTDAAPELLARAQASLAGWVEAPTQTRSNAPDDCDSTGERAAHPSPPKAPASAKAEPAALIGYGLAKYHDSRKHYAQAAYAGLAANAARRAVSGPLDRAALSARIDRIIQTYTRDFFSARCRLGLGTDQPVFVIGLPRSGTTLTEQILASHPQMYGAGELPDLSRVADRCVQNDEHPWQAATKLDEPGSREHAQDYLKALRDGAPSGRLRISDKSPLNFFQLALAAVLFPHARVIHCQRGARDNALSIWMENFNADQRYATDFDDLAFFTGQHRRLMAHWRAHLPLKMLDVPYEDTVANLEAQARRINDFLGVPWDARCLDFHRSHRAVQTPSRWQVRQPIYTGSVARWVAYQPWLPQLETAFAALDAPPG